jgi:hypothetical protein
VFADRQDLILLSQVRTVGPVFDLSGPPAVDCDFVIWASFFGAAAFVAFAALLPSASRHP